MMVIPLLWRLAIGLLPLTGSRLQPNLAIAAPVPPAQVVEGGGYRWQLQNCQRHPGMMKRILCQVVITNRKTATGNPVIFLKKGYTRAIGPDGQRFGADYVAIGQQKGYTNIIPRIQPGDSTMVTLSFLKVSSNLSQFSALSVNYREDDGGSPYVGEYFAAVFQNVLIVDSW
jgi:hypothetical protein